MSHDGVLHLIQRYIIVARQTLEGVLLELVADTDAVVGHLHLHLTVGHTGHTHTDATVAHREADGVVQQDMDGLAELALGDVGIQLLDRRQERHLGLAAYLVLVVITQMTQQLDDVRRLSYQRLHCFLLLWLRGRLFGLMLSSHLHAHHTHPLLLLRLTAQRLGLHADGLSLHVPAAPSQSGQGYQEHIEQDSPSRAPQGGTYRDVQPALHLTHRAVVVQHADT